MKMKSLIATLAGLSLLVVAGCTQEGDVSSNGGEAEVTTIVIGGIGPLTGDASSYGIEFQRIAEIALTDVNEAWAEKDMALDIQWEDGACNGKDASTAAQKLVDVDGVQLILGGFCSSETLAAAAITEAANVLLFSPGSSSPDVSDAGPYTFRNWPADSFQATLFADIAKEMGYETVAILTEQQDYPFGISNAFKESFDGTVIEETFLSEDTDMKTQLTKLSAESPDVYLINPQTPIKGDVIFKQMQELGIEGPFLVNDATGTSGDILSTYSEYLEGSYTATVQIDEGQDGVIRLQTTYSEMHGGENIAYLSYGLSVYDAVWILAEAIESVGNDGTALKEYLDDFPGYTGLMGAVDFDENGDPLVGHSIFMIQSGEMVLQ